MLNTVREDIEAVKRNDPAAHGWLEVVLCHTPLHAIMLHRVAHWLHARLGLRLMAKLLAVFNRFWTGVEIHPGARIGRGFFLDHGAGVVIGETATVGDDCVVFHNVTLGGTGKYHGQRHPMVGDHVFIGTNAILLGPLRVGDHAKVGANAFVINRDVPAHATVVGTPARMVKLRGLRVDQELPRTVPPPEAVPVEIDA
ncbi:MAG TPA: serine O-acetyltransferase EpsC [Methylomirabilota bacterium]|nr:serine O-acetyltransferase EpsC [Methylomirabilota bacterium]